MWTNGKERARRFRQAVSHHRAPRTRQSILNQELHIDEGLDPGNSCPVYIPGSFTSRMLEISPLCLSTLSHKMEKTYTTMMGNQGD